MPTRSASGCAAPCARTSCAEESWCLRRREQDTTLHVPRHANARPTTVYTLRLGVHGARARVGHPTYVLLLLLLVVVCYSCS